MPELRVGAILALRIAVDQLAEVLARDEPALLVELLGAALEQELVGLRRAGRRLLRRAVGAQAPAHARRGARITSRQSNSRRHAHHASAGSRRQPSILRLDPFFERHLRREPQILPRERRVGVGVAHVALLRRLRARSSSGWPASRSMISQHVVHRHARAAADVVGAARHAALAGRDRRRHGVGDEREVARLLAVAVERDRLVLRAPRG